MSRNPSTVPIFMSHLLLNLYEPQSGHIALDGLALNQIDPAVLRSFISYVPQNLVLFKGTLRQNLMLANPEASRSRPHALLKCDVSTFTLSGL